MSIQPCKLKLVIKFLIHRLEMHKPVQLKKRLKDIIPEPVEPGGVHPKLGGQVDAQWESAVHGVVKESPAERQSQV